MRLGDIGDVSASFSGKSFLKPKLDGPRSEIETKNYKDWSNSESPRASIDNHNWENWNPNPKEYDLGLEETDRRNLRMGFGMVNRKRRLKKQWTWNMNGGALDGAWNSRVSPGVSNKNEKAYGYGNSNGHSVNTDYGHLDHDSWDKDEDTCEGNSSDPLLVNSWKRENDLPSDGVHCLSDKIGSEKKPKEVSTIVNSVKEWLMELGFGKYAGLFEMHEVDGEALPLLTYEDLKEMGIAAVGTRRRIYSAIQLLSKGSDNTR